MVTDDGARYTWPLLGREVPLASFEDFIWAGSELLFVVALDDGAPVGILQGYGADLHSKVISISFMLSDRVRLSGWPIEALVMFIEVLFSVHGYRKIYLRVPNPASGIPTSSLQRFCRKEATLTAHVPLAEGGLADLDIWSLQSATWESALARRMTGLDVSAGDRAAHLSVAP
jgi:hypothetical protein